MIRPIVSIVYLFFVMCFSCSVAVAQSRKQIFQQFEKAVTRQAAQRLMKPKVFYHPVFGYEHEFAEVAKIGFAPLWAQQQEIEHCVYDACPVQVAPLVTPVKDIRTAKEFVKFDFMLPHQLAEGFYLWRVAHPDAQLQPSSYYRYFSFQAQSVYHSMFDYQVQHGGLTEVLELPNLQLIKQLLNPHYIPTSYAQLYESTRVYPKHITLDGNGFPVKTPEADYAELLDNYLILSNPKEMGAFNNAAAYTPFTLTPQEHAAADRLLTLRLQAERLPQNPTVRDLLELAYNRLETHTAKYTQVDQVGLYYKAYPNYRNTQLYRTIQGVIQNQTPLIVRDSQGHMRLKNKDMTHLIVLDGIMGGIDLQSAYESMRVLESFEALCAEVHPQDIQAIAHMSILRDNLRIVFYPFTQPTFHVGTNPGADLVWEKEEQKLVRAKVWNLLHRDISELIGKHWEL